jgi:hypothetical protein
MKPVVNLESLEQGEASTPLLVEVASALNEYEVNALQAAGLCVRQHFKSQYHARAFVSGGNYCTYMSAFLQLLAPGVVAQLQSVTHLAWQAAGWNNTIISDSSHEDKSASTSQYPNPRSLGLRTTEILSYKSWKHLAKHADTQSVYTIVVALSDPDSSYDGGEFYLEASDSETFFFRPPRLSAVVFISETQHGIKEITRGVRESFATEFWIHDDATFGMKRPNFHEWSRMLRNFKGRGLLDDYDENELIDVEEDANNQYGDTNAEEEHGDEYVSTDAEEEFEEYGEGHDDEYDSTDSEEEYEHENSEVKNYNDEYDSIDSEEEYEEYREGHDDEYDSTNSEEEYEHENSEVKEHGDEYDSTDSEEEYEEGQEELKDSEEDYEDENSEVTEYDNEYDSTDSEEEYEEGHEDEYDSTDLVEEYEEYGEGQDEINDSEEEYEDENSEVQRELIYLEEEQEL